MAALVICTFEFDSIANKYSSEWILTEDTGMINSVYVSSSPHVTTEVKYATGKHIQDLWQQHIAYSKQNKN